jgi:hypothetical protein
MDSSVKRRLTLGFISNWISKLASTIIQLIQVPVFLHFWTVPIYGEWTYVVPAPLSIAQDTPPAFLASMLHYPQSLRPAALLARVRRSRPGLES